jgi:DNA polymerase-3 subunit delta
MRIRFQQLAAQLEMGLAPVYLIAGDEPLQILEAGDAIRALARAQGYEERRVLEVAPGFDWSELEGETATLSLFGARQLIDLRMPTARPGAAGGKALAAFAQHPPDDTVLLVTTAKPDRSASSSHWFKALDGAGVVVHVWPLSLAETQRWIEARMRARGLVPDREAVRLLAAQAEGNLPAAHQEIEKLALLQGGGRVDAATLLSVSADSARYTVFDLSDASVAGEAPRAVRILNVLREEGVAPALVLWTLAEQLRTLVDMSSEIGRGRSLEAVMRPVWQKRRPIVKQALARFPGPVWCRLLRRCAALDRLIKGVEDGSPWEELLQLIADICGLGRYRPAQVADRSAGGG